MKDNNPICVGSGLITLDILIKGNDYRNLSYYLGGSCGNVIMILSHLGWDTYPIARLSNDKNADRILAELKNNCVHLDYIYKNNDGSTPQIIQRNISDKEGNPKHKFEFFNPKTGKRLPWFKSITKKMADTILTEMISPTVFYFDRATPGILALAQAYKKRGALIVFEPSAIKKEQFLGFMHLIDILKFSNQRISNYDYLFEESSIPLEIETLGEKGIRYRCNLTDKVWYSLDAPITKEVIDSSGAGDWTTSGIIYYINKEYKSRIDTLNNRDIEKALSFGQKLGGLSCGFEGARGLMKLSKDNIIEKAE